MAVPLSDDQKALLRLLAQREEGYDDIAALLGLEVGEVRARVRRALAELDAHDGSPAEASRAAAGEPGLTAVAVSPAATDAEHVPPTPHTPRPPAPNAAPVPPARHERSKAASAPRPAAGSRTRGPGDSSVRARFPRLPQSPQRRRLLAVAGGVLAVIAAVLIVVAVVGDGGGSSSTTTPSTAQSRGSENKKLTQALLKPVDGGQGEGRAVLGRLGKNVVLEVVAKGLAPSPPGESYAIWLYHSPKLVLRIGAVTVGQSGGLAARLPIPAELLAYIAGGAFGQIYVSATPEAAYKAEVAKAKAENRLPAYTGTTVLRGTITGPTVQAASSTGR